MTNSSSGLITGSKYGVSEGAGATISNAGTITATGGSGAGIVLQAGGTVFNAGSIGAASGTAIAFGGSGNNLLVLEHGYSLGGAVALSGSGNILELVGDAGAVTVGFDDNHGLANFDIVQFGSPSGHDDVLAIASTLPGTIVGFGRYHDIHDIIDLTQLNPAGVQTPTVTGHQLTVTNGSQTVVLNLDDGEDYSTRHWLATQDGNGGTDVSVACYCRGTLIRTPDGDVPVEDLAIGDLVSTLSGEAKPIRWIGQRAYGGRFIARNQNILPIHVAPWAFADGLPARELWISPEHALYLNEMLVPARQLLNGTTITRAEGVDLVEYFHIELEQHDVIFAEGAPAETFVDCDNRGMFQNADEFSALYPDDARLPWRFCAPRMEAPGADLSQVRAALQAQAKSLGYREADHRDLHLIADGQVVTPDIVTDTFCRFELPAHSRDVWLASDSIVPVETDPEAEDVRRLGVAVVRFVVSDRTRSIEARHGHPLLREGFFEAEGSHRWTDGQARLPEVWFSDFNGPVTLDVYLLTGETPQTEYDELLLAAAE